MNKIRKALLFSALLGSAWAALPSCTVKEDREPCPCYLNVSFVGRESLTTEVGLLGWKDMEMFRAGIMVEDYDPFWVKAVHKGYFSFAAYKGVEQAKPANHFIAIEVGDQADSLYAYHTEVDATGEMAYAQVTFHKQFATVHLDILKSAADMKNYSFLVEGNTCGFDLLTFEPMAGTFRFEPTVASGARVVDFRIPRQSDNSMSVTLWYRDANGSSQNLGKFPLGKYIERTGYDWTTEDLQDIYIVIDLVLGQIIISVDEWEHGQTFMYYEQ